jgi:glycolate oxidase iron-sulfur subunit
MLTLAGCVQPTLAPNINAAAARLFDALRVSLIEAPQAGCCGALRYHLNYRREGLEDMRRNIDAWWPYIEQGVEAIVMTASGCGVVVKEYGNHLAHDPAYADKARRVSELTRDISEIVASMEERVVAKLRPLPDATFPRKVAFHSPCTLQHGQRVVGKVEQLLRLAGYELTLTADAHLCCGAAGTYSLLHRQLSAQLRDDKLRSLQAGDPNVIATANIGCLIHLQIGSEIPVRHWIELIASRLTA